MKVYYQKQQQKLRHKNPRKRDAGLELALNQLSLRRYNLKMNGFRSKT